MIEIVSEILPDRYWFQRFYLVEIVSEIYPLEIVSEILPGRDCFRDFTW